MRHLSARHVLSLAAIVEAVQGGQKVRWVTNDGSTYEGTLRHFTAGESAALFAGEDIRDSHVRITTVHGFETWIETLELVGLYEEGALSLR